MTVEGRLQLVQKLLPLLLMLLDSQPMSSTRHQRKRWVRASSPAQQGEEAREQVTMSIPLADGGAESSD